jgi:hypothetical protein
MFTKTIATKSVDRSEKYSKSRLSKEKIRMNRKIFEQKEVLKHSHSQIGYL